MKLDKMSALSLTSMNFTLVMKTGVRLLGSILNQLAAIVYKLVHALIHIFSLHNNISLQP